MNNKVNNFILVLILLLASFLRLWKIDQNPVSLFGDEVDVGYQAYSILKTGKDYSGNAWPIHFQSLAEWRTPLYIYSAVPTIAIFGISTLGVRLPAAIFGILGVLAFYLLILEISNLKLAIIASFLLTVSPWHLQYSRAGFEVTLLLFLLLLGLYLFFKSLKEGKYLWISAACFALSPWVYSTAKFFTPLLLFFLLIVFRKEILKVSKKNLTFAFLAFVIFATPITVSTIYGGGTQRFGYISVFTDPTTEPEVGTARLRDARMRGEMGEGLNPTFLDRVIHNKFTFWGGNVIRNYLQSFSTDFLFIKGDSNPRHSIGIGEFYKIEAISLILGLVFFLTKFKDKKIKLLIIFWILAGVIPSAITRDGGNHATRLILILLPLIFLITYGIVEGSRFLKGNIKKIFLVAYFGIWFLEIGNYLHTYYVHYPWDSERWWHAGYKESIQTIKTIDIDYDKIIISMAGEPAWIFFAGFYEYPPDKWHYWYDLKRPDGPLKKINIEGFGDISYLDKFYFGSPNLKAGLYDLGKVIDNKTLYLAVAKEIGANLIMEPARTPPDLKLLKTVAYPSGEPAFYIFTKK